MVDSNSTGLYHSEWSFVVQHENTTKLVLIYSWNEYHERSSIEPHFGAIANVNSSYLLGVTAGYIGELQG